MNLYRWLHSAIVLIVIAAMLFAIYYLEGVLYLDPCPLCMMDRAIFVIIAIISLIAILHNPSGMFLWIYSLLGGIFALLGVSVAARHIWLQGLPPDQVPECGPDLLYMLDSFPLADVMKRVFTGSGQCAEVSWTFLGLTIPQQTLLLFILLLVGVTFAHRIQTKI